MQYLKGLSLYGLLCALILFAYTHHEATSYQEHAEGTYVLEIVFKNPAMVLPMYVFVDDAQWGYLVCLAEKENMTWQHWNALQKNNATVICAKFYEDEI